MARKIVRDSVRVLESPVLNHRAARDARGRRWRRALEAADLLISAESRRAEEGSGPESARLLAGCYIRRSGLCLMSGSWRKGWDSLMRAYEVAPSFAAEYAEGREWAANRSNPRLERGASREAQPADGDLIRSLDGILRHEPRLAQAWAWRGLLKRRGLDYGGAVADLERARSLRMGSAMVLSWLGEAKLQIGDASGMRDLERALERPCQAWNYAWCGRSKIHFGRGADSLRFMDCAVRMEPRNAWYRAWRAELKRLLRIRKGMFEDFDRALALDAQGRYEGFIRTWRGLACLQSGRYGHALSDFNRALTRMPDYPLAVSGRAQAFRRLGRLASWLKDMERSVALDHKYMQSLQALPPKTLDSYLIDLDKVARLRPRDAASHRWRGIILALLRRVPEALEVLDRTMALDPRDSWALAWRGQLRHSLGDMRHALRDLNRAVHWAPTNAVVLGWRAKVFAGMGLVGRALDDLDRSVEADQRFAWIFAERGRLRLLSGRSLPAVRDLERAVRLDKNDVDARVDLSIAYGQAGRGDSQRRGLSAARKLDRPRVERRLKIWKGHGGD